MSLKFSVYSVIILGCVVFVTTGMHAESKASPKQDSPLKAIIASPVLSTDTWGVFDPETGAILAGNNTEVSSPIASITKLFTAVVVMQSESKDTEFKITDADVFTEGRAGKLVAGRTATPYELLFPLLIESSNDAGVAIKRTIGDEFDVLLHRVIQVNELGNTIIVEPTGLSAKNMTTVADLSKFYSYLRKTYPHILDITRLDTYIDTHTGYINSDPVQKIKNFAGGKQGYTDEAGRTFVGTFTLPNSSREIGVVLFKSANLRSDVKEILLYANEDFGASDILEP